MSRDHESKWQPVSLPYPPDIDRQLQWLLDSDVDSVREEELIRWASADDTDGPFDEKSVRPQDVLGAARWIKLCAPRKADHPGPVGVPEAIVDQSSDECRWAAAFDKCLSHPRFTVDGRAKLLGRRAAPAEVTEDTVILGRFEAMTDPRSPGERVMRITLREISICEPAAPDTQIPYEAMAGAQDGDYLVLDEVIAPGQLRRSGNERFRLMIDVCHYASEVFDGRHDIEKTRSSGYHSRIGRCPHCGKLFVREVKTGFRKYCCPKCETDANR